MASIKVSAEKLKAACENYLTKHKERIERELEKAIWSHVGKRKYWFGPRHTYESATYHIKNDGDFFTTYERITIHGRRWADTAEDFLKLANNGDPVTLTDEDVWILDHLPEGCDA